MQGAPHMNRILRRVRDDRKRFTVIPNAAKDPVLFWHATRVNAGNQNLPESSSSSSSAWTVSAQLYWFM